MSWRLRIAIGLLWGLWAPAAIGGGMALATLHALVAAIASPWGKLKSALDGRVVWIAPILATLAWAGLSLLWRLGPPTEQLPKTALGLLAAFGLCAAIRQAPAASVRVFLWGAVAAIGLTIGFGLIEATFDLAINRIFQPDAPTGLLERNPAKAVACLTVTAPAVALWLAFRPAAGPVSRIAAGLIGVTVAYLSTKFGVFADEVAVALGLAGAVAAWIAPRFALRCLSVGIAGLILTAPIVYGLIAAALNNATLPDSWSMRLDIWASAIAAIGERPLLGWGMDATRDLRENAHYFMSLHTHSFGLQMWLELGFVGAVLVALSFGIGLWRLATRLAEDRLAAAAAASLIGAAASFWLVGYGAWQEWWIATLAIAASLVSAITNAQGAKKATFNR